MQGLERELEPGQLAALAKALDTILERKRILRMRPAPKPIDVLPKQRRVAQLSASLAYPDPASPASASTPSAASSVSTPTDAP